MEKITILLVEDEDNHIELIKRAFLHENNDFTFIVTHNLESARYQLDRFVPDLIIADLNLPDGRCIELLLEQGNRFPMIVMTSQGNEKLAVEAMKAGALDYMVKSKESLESMPWAARRAVREWRRIVEHERTIKALKQNEEKYRTIVEEASDAIFILDLEGRILNMNLSGLKMLYYSIDEILNLNFRDLFVSGESPETEFEKLVAGQTVIKEFFLRCKDKSTIPVEVSLRKLLNGKIIGIARNITIRKISELESRRNREEMERFNRLAVGRELRMIELKKEINRLLVLLGQSERYRIYSPEEMLK